jgi:hypothetical protein
MLGMGADDLAVLDDEFSDGPKLAGWKDFAQVERWPNRTATLDVDRTSPGHLYLEPSSAAWWQGYHGVFLFKEIEGDFVVATRVWVKGKSGDVPKVGWTISGLMARKPGDLAKNPAERKENWVYLMTGSGPQDGMVLDWKSTRDSRNIYDVAPSQAGWVELRMVRVGSAFFGLYRFGSEPWRVMESRRVRPDLPAKLQVGINATSGIGTSEKMSFQEYNERLHDGGPAPDSVSRFDYVRFRRPVVSAAMRARLAEPAAMTDEEVVRLAGPNYPAGCPGG